MVNDEIYDLAIIGGGINGTGVAVDASHRGLRVLLCEQNDLGSATSSASSKLIHGGLRYLEQYEFKLVREGLNERENLLHNAKHLVKPLNFILPHHSKLRSRLFIRIGLYLYDHLARHSSLAKTKMLTFNKHPARKYLKEEFKYGFQYSDCRADDVRLVITNALAAKKIGAEILTYTECTHAKRTEDHWRLTLKDKFSGMTFQKKSRTLINATGPWTEIFLQKIVGASSQHHLTLVKGSHIIVHKLYAEDFAFILQNDDGRVVFIIPYLSQFSLIGTTDVLVTEPSDAVITKKEIDYLLGVTNQYFTFRLTAKDVLHSFSGIRPLLKEHANNPARNTRDYAIEVNGANSQPILISIFGGKLTTYRKLAEKVVNLLKIYFKELTPSTTSHSILPGADYIDDATLLADTQSNYPWLPPELLSRYLQQYGTNISALLVNCKKTEDLGRNFGANLYQREIDYLISNEWAKTTEDILLRRTKLYYTFPSENIPELAAYLRSAINCA